MEIINCRVTILIIILNYTGSSSQAEDKPEVNPLPNYHPYINPNLDTNHDRHPNNHRIPSHNPHPNYHAYSTFGRRSIAFSSQMNNNSNDNPEHNIHDLQLSVNNRLSTPGRHSISGEYADSVKQHLASAHPTLVLSSSPPVHPTAAQRPFFAGQPSSSSTPYVPLRFEGAPSSSVNPSSAPFLHISNHNGIRFHAGPYPFTVKPYRYRKRGAALVYDKIKFPSGFYKLREDGYGFNPVSANEEFRVLISVIDDYVLGILSHRYLYSGLYVKLNDGNYARVTKPPGHQVAELMVQREWEYFHDRRQFEPISREKIY